MQSIENGSPSDAGTETTVTPAPVVDPTQTETTVTPAPVVTPTQTESIVQRLADLDAKVLLLQGQIEANTKAIADNTSATTDIDIDDFHNDFLALKWAVEGH